MNHTTEHRLLAFHVHNFNALPPRGGYWNPIMRFRPYPTSLNDRSPMVHPFDAANACWYGAGARARNFNSHPNFHQMSRSFAHMPSFQPHSFQAGGNDIWSRLSNFGINLSRFPSQPEIQCAINHLEQIRSMYQPQQWAGNYRPYGATHGCDYQNPYFTGAPCDCDRPLPGGPPPTETREPPLAPPGGGPAPMPMPSV